MGFEQPEVFKTQILVCNRLRVVLLSRCCKELMVSLAYNFIIPMRHSVSSSLSPFPQILKEFHVNFRTGKSMAIRSPPIAGHVVLVPKVLLGNE